MVLQTIRIGSAEDIIQYDDVDYDSAVETSAPIKAGTPVDPEDVIRLDDSPGITATKVATVTGIDMQTAAAKTNLYTVPAGKTFYPTAVVVRDPSASMAGGTDYDFGSGALCTTWRQTIDFSSMTTPNTDFMIVRGADVTKYSEEAAASVFGVYVNTGTTVACTVTMDIYGLLV